MGLTIDSELVGCNHGVAIMFTSQILTDVLANASVRRCLFWSCGNHRQSSAVNDDHRRSLRFIGRRGSGVSWLGQKRRLLDQDGNATVYKCLPNLSSLKADKEKMGGPEDPGPITVICERLRLV